MKVYTSTFYKSNISPYLLFYQKQVFKMLGIELHQICDNDITHGDFMTRTLRDVDADYFVIFDIDCIPLKPEAIIKVLSQVKDNKTLAGCAQTASHFNDGKNVYIGPCFFAISKALYLDLAAPDLNRNEELEVDPGGVLTKLAKEKGYALKYWYPTDIEEEKWKLYPDGMFGIGTTYESLVYHLFESRYDQNIVKFIKKSKQTITNNKNRNPLLYVLIQLEIQMFKIKMKFGT